MPLSAERPSAAAAGDVPKLAGAQPERVSDIELAREIAEAVRRMPEIADLTAGRAMAKTYGPGETIVGVTVAHPSPDEMTIRTHVVVALSHLRQVSASARKGEVRGAISEAPRPQPTLLALVDDVRATVRQAVSRLRTVAVITVDVFVEDIQDDVRRDAGQSTSMSSAGADRSG